MAQHYTTGAQLDRGYYWGDGSSSVSSPFTLVTGSPTREVTTFTDISKLSKFEQAALDIGKIVATKNAEYGNSAIESGDILKVLYKDVINTDTTNMLLVTRILDKLSRISHAKDSKTVLDAMLDICGYGLIGYLNTKETMDLEKLEED